MSRVVCIYQFANPITNENSTYLGILLLNNKLQAVMPYLSDFYTFTLLRQWKGGTSFQKKRARSKVLEAKSSIFHFWQKSDQRLCKQNMKVCILWVKVLWVHTLLFLISYSIFTSYFYRWKGGGGWNWWQWTVTQNVWCEISLHCARKEELSIE